MRTVRRIGIGSAFKVGAVLSALLVALFGIPFLILPGLLGASLLGTVLSEQGQGAGEAAGALGAGLVGSLVFYIVAIISSAIFGGIGYAIQALIYNLVAGWVGGIEVELL